MCFAKEHTASGFSAFLVIAMSIIKLHVAIDVLCAASRQSSGHERACRVKMVYSVKVE